MIKSTLKLKPICQIQNTNMNRHNKCLIYLVILTFVVSIKVYQRILTEYDFRMKRTNSFFIHEKEKRNYSEVKEKKVRVFKNIIFLETSQEVRLNVRTVCAIESAARVHTDKSVYLYIIKKKEQDELYFLLKSFHNVHLMNINLEQYAAASPLKQIISSGALNASKWRTSHTSDLLRLLTSLYLGGIYLDTDVIVLKRLDDLGNNFLGMEGNKTIGTNVLGITNRGVGRKFLKEAIRMLSVTFDGSQFLHNGPKLITRVLKQFCKGNIISIMRNNTCKDFHIYPAEYFNPIPYSKSISLLFDTNPPIEITNQSSRVLHVWGSLTGGYNITERSLLARMMKRYCPNTLYVAKQANKTSMYYTVGL